jgi:hypothetical protein
MLKPSCAGETLCALARGLKVLPPQGECDENSFEVLVFDGRSRVAL